MKNRLLNLFFAAALMSLIITPGKIASSQTTGAPQKPPMFALQIAVGKYADNQTWRGLSGTYTDVGEMKKLLIGERFQIPAANVRTLIDEQATKKQIFDAFEKHLIENARQHYEKTRKRDAVILFQFSGHGSQSPDADGDETDGFDETLVTYDSQDLPGKNFDITDDEIYVLTGKLKQYTDNIVYILDSCHSGSGTRDAGDTRRLPARKNAAVAILKDATRSGAGKVVKDNEQTDFLPAGNDYIVISASQANQLAGQKDVFECDTCPKKIASYGYLTFYLIEELKNAKDDTSYRELMENVRRKVSADKPTQTPQIEGDANRFVFGGLGNRAENYIKIAETKGGQIVFAAGAMQGIVPGTVFSVYDKAQKNFQSNEGKIAEAKTVQVYADKTVAEIVSAKREISAADKAIAAANDFTAKRLQILLDGDDAAKLSSSNKTLIQNLRSRLSTESDVKTRAVNLVDGKWNDEQTRWDIALLKDSFGKVFADRNRAAPIKNGDGTVAFPDAERQIFYLAGKDFVPLYGFYVEETDAEAAEKIEKALAHLSRLRSVKAIANQQSALNTKISIKPVRLINPKCEAGAIVAEKTDPIEFNSSKNSYRLTGGERFQMEITNNSASDLYINVLNLATDGSVKVLLPRAIYEERDGIKLASGAKINVLGEKCRDGVLRASFPAGTETFKIIATTEKRTRADFEFLEIDSISKRAEETLSLSESGDWTTAEINFEITTATAQK